MFLYVVFAIWFVFSWLISSVWGIFLLAVGLYVNATNLGWSEPLSFGQLLSWSAELPDEYRLGISSSLLTIVGFLIAFQVATRNWKDQMRASVQLEAATDIQSFFSSGSKLLTEVYIYANLLLESLQIVTVGQDIDRMNFEIDLVRSRTDKFLRKRDRLTKMAVDVHNLSSRHSVLLASQFRTAKNLARATDAFSAVAEHIWFPIPIVSSKELGAIDRFERAIDIEACQKYKDAYDENFDAISGLSGMVSGRLTAPITKFNVPFILNVMSSIPEIPTLLALHKKTKSNETRDGATDD